MTQLVFLKLSHSLSTFYPQNFVITRLKISYRAYKLYKKQVHEKQDPELSKNKNFQKQVPKKLFRIEPKLQVQYLYSINKNMRAIEFRHLIKSH